jgi:small ligand-binding sensory domain FIST
MKLRQTLVGIEAAAPENAATHPTQPNTPSRKTTAFSHQTRVRHIIGLDPAAGAVAVAEPLNVGDTVAFCERNLAAARADLRRICTELRSATEPDELTADMAADLAASLSAANAGSEVTANNATPGATCDPAATGMLGAVYISCAGRGGPHFGAAHAEAALVRHGLGDVPFIGFFAGGEIAHQQVHGYTGVLMVFATQTAAANAAAP